MNQHDDLKLIETTEARAKNMLRLCELARDGLKYREPVVTDSNRLARETLEDGVVMDFATSRFLDENGKAVSPASCYHTLSTTSLYHICARQFPSLREWKTPLETMADLLSRSLHLEAVPNATDLWRYKTNPIKQPQRLGSKPTKGKKRQGA